MEMKKTAGLASFDILGGILSFFKRKGMESETTFMEEPAVEDDTFTEEEVNARQDTLAFEEEAMRRKYVKKYDEDYGGWVLEMRPFLFGDVEPRVE